VGGRRWRGEGGRLASSWRGDRSSGCVAPAGPSRRSSGRVGFVFPGRLVGGGRSRPGGSWLCMSKTKRDCVGNTGLSTGRQSSEAPFSNTAARFSRPFIRGWCDLDGSDARLRGVPGPATDPSPAKGEGERKGPVVVCSRPAPRGWVRSCRAGGFVPGRADRLVSPRGWVRLAPSSLVGEGWGEGAVAGPGRERFRRDVGEATIHPGMVLARGDEVRDRATHRRAGWLRFSPRLIRGSSNRDRPAACLRGRATDSPFPTGEGSGSCNWARTLGMGPPDRRGRVGFVFSARTQNGSVGLGRGSTRSRSRWVRLFRPPATRSAGRWWAWGEACGSRRSRRRRRAGGPPRSPPPRSGP